MFGRRKIVKNWLPLVTLAIVFTAIITPLNFTGAQTEVEPPNFFECTKNPATCLIFYTSLVINKIIGVFISFAARLINLVLIFNEGVEGSPVAVSRFATLLSIANLGFVLGIIVIAITTILRSQTYGFKQLFWKLVVGAILVNFSFTIAVTIINFSDGLARNFLNAFRLNSYGDFANKLTTSFAPQSLKASPKSSEYNKCVAETLRNQGVWGVFKTQYQLQSCNVKDVFNLKNVFVSFSRFIEAIMSLVFGAIFGLMILLILLALAVMLLIRYIVLTMLLILSPLAWLMWIFPSFKHLWDKWWNTFLRWTIFATHRFAVFEFSHECGEGRKRCRQQFLFC